VSRRCLGAKRRRILLCSAWRSWIVDLGTVNSLSNQGVERLKCLRRAAHVAVSVMALLALSSALDAQCIPPLTPRQVEEAKSSGSLVFSGVLTEMSRLSLGSRMTFDVDGIWEGTLPKKAVLFQGFGETESRFLVMNEHYVVFAYPKTDRVRVLFQEAGVDPSAVFLLGSCATATYAEAAQRGYFPALGPARQPR
jgi:hypothetical protein